MKTTNLIFSGLVMGLITGCGGGFTASPQAIEHLSSVDTGQRNENAPEGTPPCVVDYADYILDSKVMSFQVTDTFGAQVGFDVNAGTNIGINLGLKVKSGAMLMNYHLAEASHPLDPTADVAGSGKFSDVDVNGGIDWGLISVDLSYAHSTPLYTVMGRSVTDGLNNMRTAMQTAATAWHTRVVDQIPLENAMIMPVGTIAGVRIGDTFAIYNVEYRWEHDPVTQEPIVCGSLLLERKLSTAPVAIVQAVQVEQNATVLNIVIRNSDDPIMYGARIEIDKLPLAKGEKSRALLRSIRLSKVESPDLLISDGSKFNFADFDREQTLVQLKNYGYYSHR